MPEEPDPIENLKKSLYSRTTPDIRTRRHFRAHTQESELPQDWKHGEESVVHMPSDSERTGYSDRTMSFLKKVFLGSAIFFFLCLAVGSYLFFNGSNLISANNVDIAVTGPVSVAGGAPFIFGVQVTNKNNVKLTTVDLEVDFPTGSVSPTDPTKEQKTYQTLMDDLNPSAVTTRTVNAALYGQENSTKEMTIKVFYQVPGSNATFEKDKAYDVLISSSPLTLSVSSFTQVTAGQKFDMTVKLTSNSQSTLQNVLLNAIYPFGYSIITANQMPLADKATWNVGNIEPGQSKSITITGTLQGQDQDTQVFNFIAGTQSAANSGIIGTEYSDTSETVTLQKPFITTAVSFGQNDSGTGDFVGQFGKPVNGKITWFNNLPDAITDAQIQLTFSGNAFDKSSVAGNGGFYDSANNQITWDKTNTSALQSIPPGGSGSVQFTLAPQNLGTPSSPVVNPHVDLSVSVNGQRISESNVPQTLTETSARTIQVASSISLSAQALHTVGPFPNSGPFPPAAESTTTYAIVWTISNSTSAVSGARVTATLPENVTWLGNVSPNTEDVEYDAGSRTVSWNAGNLAAYSGQGGQEQRQAAFQVGLFPSVTDAGGPLTLVNAATLSATDNFTQTTIYSSWGILTTRLSTDPNFQDGEDIVTK
jgi:hypothetical protein